MSVFVFQLGELVYIVSGDGLAPVPSDDHVIKSSLGSSSSIIIPFQNPFEEDIGVDITLQERPFSRSRMSIDISLLKKMRLSPLLSNIADLTKVLPSKVGSIPFSIDDFLENIQMLFQFS